MTGHEAIETGSAGSASRTPARAPVRLSLRGVSRDGATLLLQGEVGADFLLDITPGLRAALRGDASRNSTVETTMDSTLRPRDIQARIRAGESAEAVAEAAQTSVEKIMAFAVPVLAEREHMAQRAQRSNLRRPAGESASASRTLGDTVAGHLRSCNVDPAQVTWDAWRREDGRWALVADYELTLRSGSARFTFDTPGNYVMLDNEDARWLVGESVASPAPARDDLHGVRERRLSSVPPDELPLGDDAIELVAEPVDETLPLEAFYSDAPADEPAPAAAPAATTADAPAQPDGDPQPQPQTQPEPSPEPGDEGPAVRRPAQKKKGRASVPSWDEIMFGPGD